MQIKNFAMSPAATDLGLGDSLRSQLEDEEMQRKKRLAQQANAMQGYGPATQTLFGMAGGMGSAY